MARCDDDELINFFNTIRHLPPSPALIRHHCKNKCQLTPVSRGFSVWVCGYVASILSRAELASRYLVIVQARHIMAQRGILLDFNDLSSGLSLAFEASENGISVADCRARLRALRSVLSDLPRHALRLLRRIDRERGSAALAGFVPPRRDRTAGAAPRDWRLVGQRIERPPDKQPTMPDIILPPSGFRTGGGGARASLSDGLVS